MSETHITIDNVTKRFGDKQVHRGVSLTVRRGEVMTLAGGSGQGKSVLLKQIIGLLRPDSGRVLVDDDEVTALSERDLMAVRRRVGMLFQGAALFDHLSVYENIAFPLRQHGERDEGAIADRVAETLALVDLPGATHSMPAELSGGMQKRVGLARAIATRPEIILMDEPCSALDPIATLKIEDLMRDLQKNYTIVIVTHNMQQAARASDYTAYFLMDRDDRAGEMVEFGETNELFTKPKDQRTEDYITGRFG